MIFTCVTRESIMSSTWMSHISCPTHKRVMSQTSCPKRHVPHTKESRPKRVYDICFTRYSNSSNWHLKTRDQRVKKKMDQRFSSNIPKKKGSKRVTCQISHITWLIHTLSMSQSHEHLFYAMFGTPQTRGGGLGSSTIFKKFHETYAPS